MKVRRGFKAVQEEEVRKEQAREQSKGKLWRVFFPKDAGPDHEIPIVFLTEEPTCYHEHQVQDGGKFTSVTCSGDGCPHCASGNKPRFVGAFLVVDRSEFERDERDANGGKTGKKVKVNATIKLLVRGSKDLAVLAKKFNKSGLAGREWFISKTGKGTATQWDFEKGEEFELTNKEIQALLPESLRGKDLYELVDEQIDLGLPKEADDDDDYVPQVSKAVRDIDEDDEDEEEEEKAPAKPKRKLKR